MRMAQFHGQPKRNPNVKLEIHPSWFDHWMTILHDNTQRSTFSDGEKREAEELMRNCMRYARVYPEKGGAYVSVRLYESEAAKMIWQFLIASVDAYDAEKAYSRELQGADACGLNDPERVAAEAQQAADEARQQAFWDAIDAQLAACGGAIDARKAFLHASRVATGGDDAIASLDDEYNSFYHLVHVLCNNPDTAPVDMSSIGNIPEKESAAMQQAQEAAGQLLKAYVSLQSALDGWKERIAARDTAIAEAQTVYEWAELLYDTAEDPDVPFCDDDGEPSPDELAMLLDAEQAMASGCDEAQEPSAEPDVSPPDVSQDAADSP